MQKIIWIAALSATALVGQAPEFKGNMVYQQLGAIGSRAGGVMIQMLGPDGPNGQSVTGKPLSAIQERHSLQTLGDGTRIENTDSNPFYRDEQGRTRTELGKSGAVTVSIQDPIAGFVVTLDPVNKIAHKMPLPAGGPVWFSGAPASGSAPAVGAMATAQSSGVAHLEIRHEAIAVGGVATGLMPPPTAGGDVFIKRIETNLPPAATQDLGSQMVNGVTAQGTRTTMTIPAGQIGNDRPIQTVNERWFSSDLQMLVKSSNSDPRFGETTFQLTNISRVAPDPSLFQIPADYTIEEGKTGTFNMQVSKPATAQ